MGMINGLIKQLQDMLLLYGNKTILTISDGENEYDIKSITGKPCAKYFEPKDKVTEVTITVKPTVEAIPKDRIAKAIDKVEEYICDVETNTIKAQGMTQALEIIEQTLEEVEDGNNNQHN